MTRIDSIGNVHDSAGRFAGHIQREAEPGVLPAPDHIQVSSSSYPATRTQAVAGLEELLRDRLSGTVIESAQAGVVLDGLPYGIDLIHRPAAAGEPGRWSVTARTRFGTPVCDADLPDGSTVRGTAVTSDTAVGIAAGVALDAIADHLATFGAEI